MSIIKKNEKGKHIFYMNACSKEFKKYKNTTIFLLTP